MNPGPRCRPPRAMLAALLLLLGPPPRPAAASAMAPPAPTVSGFASQPGPDGRSTTTGGGSATPIAVADCGALADQLQADGPRVVQIPRDTTIDCRSAPREQLACATACGAKEPDKLAYRVPVRAQTCTELGSPADALVARTRNERRIDVKSDKTLIGLGPRARVIGASFNLTGSSNIIVRNLTIEDINPELIEAGDGFTLDHSSHIWIDHCRFQRISDGHVDIKDSQNVTLSWNHFDGRNSAVCGGQHHYTSAIDDSTVTIHHCFWDHTSGRNPKLSGGSTRVHLYDNYWLGVLYYCVNASHGAQAKLEGNSFEDSSKPHWNEDGSGFIDAPPATQRYIGRSADPRQPRDTGSAVFRDLQLYPYRVDPVDAVPARLRSGAGPQ